MVGGVRAWGSQSSWTRSGGGQAGGSQTGGGQNFTLFSFPDPYFPLFCVLSWFFMDMCGWFGCFAFQKRCKTHIWSKRHKPPAQVNDKHEKIKRERKKSQDKKRSAKNWMVPGARGFRAGVSGQGWSRAQVSKLEQQNWPKKKNWPGMKSSSCEWPQA